MYNLHVHVCTVYIGYNQPGSAQKSRSHSRLVTFHINDSRIPRAPHNTAALLHDIFWLYHVHATLVSLSTSLRIAPA